MFNKKKQPPIKSVIAHGTRIVGDVHYHDGLQIDGEVVGGVLASDERPSILVVSEQAVITGQAQADHVIINGRVKGPVVAHELLELQPKARLEGDVSYKALEMHQGATIEGQLKPLSAGGFGASSDDKPTLKLAANNG